MLDVLGTLFTTSAIGWLVLAALAGMIIGAIPGLGGVVGLALLLPFIGDLNETIAFVLIVGLTSTVTTGDTIPAVLWGVPGTAGSQATVLDGHALAKKGEAVRALSAAYVSSLLGGVFGAVVLLVTLPVAATLVLSVGSPEMLMIALVGLAMVAVLSGKAPVAGLILVLFGVLLGMVGQDPQSGIYRGTFGQAYLLQGVPLVPLALGLFAIPEAMQLAARGRYLEGSASLKAGVADVLTGARDVVRHWFLVVRCSSIGVAVGAMPGIGSSVVDWLAYAHAAQTSRGNKRFGDGDIRGVIAPESANNSKVGGSLIPTLIFGVPGGLTMVFVLVAMTMYGLNPGPRLVTERPELMYLLIAVIVVANVVAVVAGFGLLPLMARLALAPAHLLAPAVTAAVVVAAYQTTWHVFDLVVVGLAGILGCAVHRAGWSRPALILAFVLAPIVEQRFHISNQSYGLDWLTRPGVLLLGAGVVASLVYGVLSEVRAARAARQPERASSAVSPGGTLAAPAALAEGTEPAAEARGRAVPLDTVLAVLLMAVFAYTLYLGLDWPRNPRWMAIGTTIPGLIFCAGMLLHQWRRGRERKKIVVTWPEARYLLWFLAALVATWLAGLVLGLTLFMLAYVKRAPASWRTALLASLVTAVFLQAIVWLFNFRVPAPVLPLPW
ncbi:MAG: hypothetical protein GEU28_14110 [Dehalococcoidia bacterium]|nr:hypothetical protein [Dehalococcoidia bacterium]